MINCEPASIKLWTPSTICRRSFHSFISMDPRAGASLSLCTALWDKKVYINSIGWSHENWLLSIIITCPVARQLAWTTGSNFGRPRNTPVLWSPIKLCKVLQAGLFSSDGAELVEDARWLFVHRSLKHGADCSQQILKMMILLNNSYLFFTEKQHLCCWILNYYTHFFWFS